MDFDPDAYLAQKTGQPQGFDPDAYLSQKTGQPAPQGKSWADVAESAATSFLPSVGHMIGGIAESVMHPIDTATNLGKLVVGAGEAGAEKLAGMVNPELVAFNKQLNAPSESQQMAQNVGQYYAQKYGTEEGFKKALAEDPAGVLADAASVLSAGGGLASKVPALQKAGIALNQAAATVDPLALTAKGVGAVLSPVGNLLQAKYQNALTESAKTAPLQQTLKEAVGEGYVVPPSSVSPAIANKVIESISGKAATGQQASLQNQSITDSLARKALNLPETTPLTQETMQAVRNAAAQTGYEPIRGIGQISTDAKYISDLKNIEKPYLSAEKSFPTGAPLATDSTIKPMMVDKFDASDALDKISTLRQEANAAYASGNNALGAAKKAAANAVENVIQRNLESRAVTNPIAKQVLDNYKNARVQIAKAHDIEDAIREGGGTVDARILGRKLQAGAPLSGELKTIGKFANNYPKAVQRAEQASGAGVSKVAATLATLFGGGGAVAGGPAGAMLGAAIPFAAPELARRYLLSGRVQKQLPGTFGPSLTTRVGAALNTPEGRNALASIMNPQNRMAANLMYQAQQPKR